MCDDEPEREGSIGKAGLSFSLIIVLLLTNFGFSDKIVLVLFKLRNEEVFVMREGVPIDFVEVIGASMDPVKIPGYPKLVDPSRFFSASLGTKPYPYLLVLAAGPEAVVVRNTQTGQEACLVRRMR